MREYTCIHTRFTPECRNLSANISMTRPKGPMPFISIQPCCSNTVLKVNTERELLYMYKVYIVLPCLLCSWELKDLLLTNRKIISLPYYMSIHVIYEYYIQYIVAVLTKPRKWKMPTFQEKVKTKYLFVPKTRCQPNKDIITCLNVCY